jgi:hypothetical protein
MGRRVRREAAKHDRPFTLLKSPGVVLETDNPVVYRVRRTAFEKERCYRLEADALRISETGKADVLLAYAAIREVALMHTRVRYTRTLYRCRLTTDDNNKYLLVNQHFEGLGIFADKSAAYSAFILALHEKLGHHQIRFVQGAGALTYYIYLGLAALVSLLLLALLVTGMLYRDTELTMAGLSGFLPVITMLVINHRDNQPLPYPPDKIPASLLPPVAGTHQDYKA